MDNLTVPLYDSKFILWKYYDGNETGKEIYIYVVIICTIYFCDDHDIDNVSS